MKEMFLLGAGASVEAGVPDSYAMTERMFDAFNGRSGFERYTRIISFLIGGLSFQNGIRGLNPLKTGVNIEELFNAVELLANRHSLEVAPFVGSWHSMIDEFDKINPPRPDIYALHRAIYTSVTGEILNAMPRSAPSFGDSKIDRNLQDVIENTIKTKLEKRSFFGVTLNSVSRAVGDYVVKITNSWLQNLRRNPMPSRDFHREFEKAMNQTPKSGRGQIFEEVAENMIRELANIVWIDNHEKISYLNPLLEVLKSQQQLTVATLNYDNSIELLAKDKNVVCNTGIEKWPDTEAFKQPESGLLLLKLHGSIDWASYSNQPDANHPLPYTTIKSVDPEKVKESGFRPAVVFGHGNKLTAEGPFLELLRVFQVELNSVNRLTIIGYSFGDDHINTYLKNWLNQDINHQVRIINPNFNKISDEFVKSLQTIDKVRVEIIEKTASTWLIGIK
jgi:hypothetical protein